MSRFLRFFQDVLGRNHLDIESSFRPVLAWDPGSSHTRVWQKGRVIWSQPSLGVIHDGSLKAMAVGDRAAEMRGKLPPHMSLWEPIQRGQVRLTDQSKSYIDTVLQRSLEGANKVWFPSITTLVPVHATPSYNRGLELLLRSIKADLRAVHTQPVAAWKWLQHQKKVSNQGCVIVIGGGITEIGFFQGGVAVTEDRFHVGGRDFSERMRQTIRSELQIDVSSQVIEHLKRNVLSLLSNDQDDQKTVIKGKHIATQVPATAIVSGLVLREAGLELAERLATEIQVFLRSLPSESLSGLIDHGVVITGGGSRVAGLASYLEKALQLRVITSDTPELDVIQGLGLYGG